MGKPEPIREPDGTYWDASENLCDAIEHAVWCSPEVPCAYNGRPTEPTRREDRREDFMSYETDRTAVLERNLIHKMMMAAGLTYAGAKAALQAIYTMPETMTRYGQQIDPTYRGSPTDTGTERNWQ